LNFHASRHQHLKLILCYIKLYHNVKVFRLFFYDIKSYALFPLSFVIIVYHAVKVK
jgi:hypothetical protein